MKANENTPELRVTLSKIEIRSRVWELFKYVLDCSGQVQLHKTPLLGP